MGYSSKLRAHPKNKIHKEANMLVVEVWKKLNTLEPLLGKVTIIFFSMLTFNMPSSFSRTNLSIMLKQGHYWMELMEWYQRHVHRTCLKQVFWHYRMFLIWGKVYLLLGVLGFCVVGCMETICGKIRHTLLFLILCIKFIY